MKMNFRKPLMLLFGAGLVLVSCNQDADEALIDENVNADATLVEDINAPYDGEVFIIEDTNLRQRVGDKHTLELIEQLELDKGRVTKGEFVLPDGSVEERIFIGDDIATTLPKLEALKKIQDQSTDKQYRTFNLVTGSNRTIDIIGYTGNDQFGLSNKAQTALRWAVNNYNRLSGVSLNFRLTFGTNFGDKDMVVYDNSANNPGSQGGVADFPENDGRPNKFVQIYNIEQFSTNVNEHVITHEIGHSIGFRHSDWFDRLSCPASSQGNEFAGSDGAVHVAGTPTGRDLTSVMQACFATNEDGEFNNNDITALRRMY